MSEKNRKTTWQDYRDALDLLNEVSVNLVGHKITGIKYDKKEARTALFKHMAESCGVAYQPFHLHSCFEVDGVWFTLELPWAQHLWAAGLPEDAKVLSLAEAVYRYEQNP